MSRDPIGFAGGLNLYEYASSSPVTKADPTGLWVQVLVGGVLITTEEILVAGGIVTVGTIEGHLLKELVTTAPPVEAFAFGLPHHAGSARAEILYWNNPAVDASVYKPGDLNIEARAWVMNPSRIPWGAYNPQANDRRGVRRRKKWGLSSDCEDIPEQTAEGDGRAPVVHPKHSAKVKTPHPTGQRNVGAQEEHSRVAKGSGGRGARRR